MKTFIIGISGVTNGGKTTLAKNLQKHLPNCSIISQDDFFKPESEIETDKNGFLQYDGNDNHYYGTLAFSKKAQKQHPVPELKPQDLHTYRLKSLMVLEALDMDKMLAAISCWMESPEHTGGPTDQERAEEISILIIEGFLIFNYKPFDTIWNRSYFLTIPYEECKRRRSTRVYDPPDIAGYFDGHVWPMYLKHRKELEHISWEIVSLDGTKSEEDLFCQVYEDLMKELATLKGLQETARK